MKERNKKYKNIKRKRGVLYGIFKGTGTFGDRSGTGSDLYGQRSGVGKSGNGVPGV